MARYHIAPERSQVWIDARSNVHPIHSSTDGLEGYVDLEFTPDGVVDPDTRPAGTLTLAVSRLSSGNRLEDREMLKRIDARRFPTISGILGSVAPNGSQGSYRVNGEITFKGVSRAHEDDMDIHAIDERTVHLGGTSRFDIREYGMEPPRVLLLRVEPEVEIRVEIFAVREPAGG